MPKTKERSAASEVIGYSYKLVISAIPILPLKWRKSLYKSYVDGLGDKTFDMFGIQVIGALCFAKSNSKQFKGTKQETNAILEWIPRFKKYCDILKGCVRKQRQKYNLKV